MKVQIKADAEFYPNMIGELKTINQKYNTGMFYSEKGSYPYRVVVSLDDIIYIEE